LTDTLTPPEPSSGDPRPLLALERLKKRWQFLAVAKGAASARGAVLIQALARTDPAPRPVVGVGFTATKRLGGAVVRNRAKRRMREAARLLLPLHGLAGFDYVLIARSGIVSRPWARLLDDVKSALISVAAGGDPPPTARRRAPPRPPGT
jgi:ribonuclease P protein component